MAFTPAARKKAFLIERVGDGLPSKATLESVPNPRWEALPQIARDAVGDSISAEVLKLTMPDGSEWLVEDQTLRDLLDAVAETRAYYAEATD
jgi:hypothetical protein